MSTRRVSLCSVNELDVGEMKQLSVGEKEVLLAHISEDKFVATAAKCSHYGAPLANGVMHNGRVVCPWHNACYNLADGAQLEPPGRDNLASYTVMVKDGEVFVELPTDGEDHLVPDMASAGGDDRRFVIVGAGAAGLAAAEMLREVGFAGEVLVLGAEEMMPYDRTKLSKAALQSDEFDGPSLLRSQDFYAQHDIEIKTNAPVEKADVRSQTVTYGKGETVEYDSLLIATGGKVRSLPVDNSDLQNVFTIRKADDTKEILQAAKDAKKAVIIGAGFIGMEAAASLRQKGLEVTVVAPNKVPFEKVLGEEVGAAFQRMHESEGVTFKMESKAKALNGNGKVESVQLDSGETLDADLVIVGIGVSPATDFIEGLALDDDDKSVPVNQYLQAAPNVYAAGDIAQFPHFASGKSVRIEHWRLAMQHGRIAAINMAADETDAVPFKAVPFFWSGQFDAKLRYVGHSENYDEIVVQGDLDNQKFLSFYIEEGKVLAVAGIGRDKDIAAISEMMRLGEMPTVEDVKGEGVDWTKKLASV